MDGLLKEACFKINRGPTDWLKFLDPVWHAGSSHDTIHFL